MFPGGQAARRRRRRPWPPPKEPKKPLAAVLIPLHIFFLSLHPTIKSSTIHIYSVPGHNVLHHIPAPFPLHSAGLSQTQTPNAAATQTSAIPRSILSANAVGYHSMQTNSRRPITRTCLGTLIQNAPKRSLHSHFHFSIPCPGLGLPRHIQATHFANHSPGWIGSEVPFSPTPAGENETAIEGAGHSFHFRYKFPLKPSCDGRSSGPPSVRRRPLIPCLPNQDGDMGQYSVWVRIPALGNGKLCFCFDGFWSGIQIWVEAYDWVVAR